MRNILLLLMAVSATGVFAHQTEKEENKISYIANKGQWENNVLFKAQIGGGDVWLEKNSVTYMFYDQQDLEEIHDAHHSGQSITQTVDAFAYRMNFIGASEPESVTGQEKSNGYHNYFKGNDPAKWKGNVPLYHTVNYKNIYPGIDLRFHSKDGHMKYDFVVSQGTHPSAIRWNYEGVNPVIKNGNIVITTSAGEVTEMKPVAWQVKNNKKLFISCQYQLENGILTFDFPEGYDTQYEIIIDPTLIFSSYTGSTADNWGFTATYDNNGSLYSGGIVFGAGYPTTAGAYDLTFGGGNTDVGISKFTPTGNNLVFSTYLGGNNSEAPHSLIVDASGNLFVLGTTSSTNFPVSAGCYDNSFNGGVSVSPNGFTYSNGSDMFVAQFNSAGSALTAATYIGGTGNDGFNSNATLSFNYSDEMRGEIYLAANGDVLVASSTLSNNFPTTAGSLSQTFQGTQDGVAFRMNSGLTTLSWSTYIGGSGGDSGYGIKESSLGTIYVCGGTISSDFPVTGSALQPTFQGGTCDGYIVSLDPLTGAQVKGTYLGTNSYDQTYLIEIDINDDVYVTGQTKGAWPVSGGVYSNANGKQFIHKLDPSLSATIYSTVFGSGNTTINISPTAFLVDNCENVYVSGWGGNVNVEGNTAGLAVTSDAYQLTTDGSDFYFIVLERDANSLLYATFFGGPPAEHVDGGTSRFDKNGVIYQAVCAGCGGSDNFPTTPGAWSQTNNSTNCNLGAIKMEFSYLGINANANASPNIIACDPPYNVNFTGSTSGVDFFWDFGDGDTSTSQNPSHTFVNTGLYTIMHVAIDSSTCNIADTVYLTVEILQSEVFAADFNIPPYDPCVSSNFTVSLEFTGSGADSLVWNLGDGNFIYNDTLVNYTYTNPGTYIITMTAYDTVCGNTGTFSDTVSFNPNTTTATANASPNVIACDPPYNVNFTGSSTPNHYWNFDDGNISTQQNPSHTFTTIGLYNIMYVAIDSSTCNISDTAYLTVEILQSEEFSATFTPIPPQACQDTVYVNVAFTGTGADSLVWDMGDGTIFINDTAVSYFYTVTGSYTLTLSAWDFTCSETGTVSQVINVGEAGINGIVQIPNVFSPNGDGVNDEFILFFANYPTTDPLPYLEYYHVEIYDRWGLKMFESGDNVKRWNGKAKGDAVTEGVYYYIMTYQRSCLDPEPIVTNGHVTVSR
ncbi:MAG: PKD domain-containing protein [Bacteroidota bacterium]